MDTKFGTNVSNRMLLNVAKFQGYIFYRFLVIKGKPTAGGGGVKLPLPPKPSLGLSLIIFIKLKLVFDCLESMCDT